MVCAAHAARDRAGAEPAARKMDAARDGARDQPLADRAAVKVELREGESGSDYGRGQADRNGATASAGMARERFWEVCGDLVGPGWHAPPQRQALHAPRSVAPHGLYHRPLAAARLRALGGGGEVERRV